MARKRVGWGMVGIAGVLLCAQLLLPRVWLAGIPGLAAEKRPGAGVNPSPSASAEPVHSVFSFQRHPRSMIMVDRRGDGRVYDLLGWDGRKVGSLSVGTADRESEMSRIQQSPDGSRFMSWPFVVGARGGHMHYDAVLTTSNKQTLTWADDGQGLCFLDGDSRFNGQGSASLVSVIFEPTATRRRSVPLPPARASSGPLEVLACSPLHRRAVLETRGAPGGLLVVDLGTGSSTLEGTAPAGPLSSGRTYSGGAVASRDGSLVALEREAFVLDLPAHEPSPAPDPGNGTKVIDVIDGRTLRTFPPSDRIEGFSGDDREVLVSSPAGTRVERLDSGVVVWSAARGVQTWTSEPGSGTFALALGAITMGSPGGDLYPVGCLPNLSCGPDLVLVSEHGRVTRLGKGTGAWDAPWRGFLMCPDRLECVAAVSSP